MLFSSLSTSLTQYSESVTSWISAMQPALTQGISKAIITSRQSTLFSSLAVYDAAGCAAPDSVAGLVGCSADGAPS